MSLWGISSAGRAPALHAGGQGFEPLILHQDFGPKKEPRKPNNVYQTNTEEKRNRDNILSESLEICEG